MVTKAQTTEDIILDQFWAEDRNRCANVKKAAQLCNATWDRNAHYIVAQCTRISLPKKYHPQEKAVGRIIGGEQPRLEKAAQMTGLFLSVRSILETAKVRTTQEDTLLSLLNQTHQELLAEMGQDFPFKGRADTTINPIVAMVLPLFTAQLSIPAERFLDVAPAFFEGFNPKKLPETSLERHFNTYRFHSRPGYVVKTFTVVKSPTTKVPLCLFSNFFMSKASATVRRASGFILPTTKTFYFLGGLPNGAGLKIMAVDNPTQGRPSRWNGLMTTFDEHERLVSARFVMTPTTAKRHDEANVGIYNIAAKTAAEKDAAAAVVDEIEDFKAELRNKIKFVLERDLLFDDTPILQASLVDEVRRALTNTNKQSRFVYSDNKEPFNPAADDEYTFNSALGLPWNEIG